MASYIIYMTMTKVCKCVDFAASVSSQKLLLAPQPCEIKQFFQKFERHSILARCSALFSKCFWPKVTTILILNFFVKYKSTIFLRGLTAKKEAKQSQGHFTLIPFIFLVNVLYFIKVIAANM